jgi:hypothetical protein
MGVPFISCLGDNPYHAPSLHSVEGPGMYLLYACKDFLETYKEFMNGRTFACTFMHAESHCGQRIHHNPAIGIKRIQFVGWHRIAKEFMPREF